MISIANDDIWIVTVWIVCALTIGPGVLWSLVKNRRFPLAQIFPWSRGPMHPFVVWLHGVAIVGMMLIAVYLLVALLFNS
jgi:hypothetical protein